MLAPVVEGLSGGWRSLGIREEGHVGDGVVGSVCRQRGASELCGGCEKIHRGRHLSRVGGRWHHPRPPGDRGHALTPLPGSALAASKGTVVAAQILPGERRAVVGREHDEGARAEARGVDRVQDLPHRPVKLCCVCELSGVCML